MAAFNYGRYKPIKQMNEFIIRNASLYRLNDFNKTFIWLSFTGLVALVMGDNYPGKSHRNEVPMVVIFSTKR